MRLKNAINHNYRGNASRDLLKKNAVFCFANRKKRGDLQMNKIVKIIRMRNSFFRLLREREIRIRIE